MCLSQNWKVNAFTSLSGAVEQSCHCALSAAEYTAYLCPGQSVFHR